MHFPQCYILFPRSSWARITLLSHYTYKRGGEEDVFNVSREANVPYAIKPIYIS